MAWESYLATHGTLSYWTERRGNSHHGAEVENIAQSICIKEMITKATGRKKSAQ